MRRRYPALCGVVLLAAIFAIWRFGYHGLNPRLILWPPADEIAAPAALEELAEIDVREMPLRDALRLLAGRHNVPIELDAFALQDLALGGDEPVSCRLSGVTLKSMLRALARDFDMVVRHRSGSIYLTSEGSWDGRTQNYVGQVYRLDRLLAAPCPPVKEESVVDMITSTIAPDTWVHARGSAVIRTVPGGIVVSHVPDVHGQIAALLDRLSEIFKSADPPTSVRLAPVSAGGRAIAEALASSAEIDVSQTPLSELCEQLSTRHGIAIQIDRLALRRVGVQPETPITARINRVSLDSALRLLLREHELTLLTLDDVLFVTTPEVADDELGTGLFPVADLVAGEQEGDHQSLIELVTSTIAPTTWSDGNARDMQGFGGVLIVFQSDEVLAQIADLLTDLRAARLPTGLAPSPRPPKSARERLELALAQPVSFEYFDAPLSEVAVSLAKQCGIHIHLDTRALDGVGESAETKVTFKAKQMPLERAVSQMLDNVDLSPMVQFESLVISTPEMARDSRETCCYRVGRLLSSSRGTRIELRRDSYELLTILNSVVGTTNRIIHGSGTNAELFENVLVVNQSREQHAQVRGLLAELHSLREKQPSPTTVLVGDSAPRETLALERRLGETVSLEYVEALFPDIVAHLREEYGLPLRLDLTETRPAPGDRPHPFGPRTTATDVNAPTATADSLRRPLRDPVSFSAKNVPLKDALSQLLETWQLYLAPRDGELWVVPLERFDLAHSLRLYDARDLQAFSEGDSISDALQIALDEVTLGVAEREGIVAANCAPKMHRLIEQLLAALRGLAASPDSIVSVNAGTRLNMSVRVYPVADLRRAAGWHTRPFSARDLIDESRGWVGFQGTRLPEYRPDPLRTILSRCLHRRCQSQFLGSALVVAGSAEAHSQIEVALGDLRHILLAGEALPKRVPSEENETTPVLYVIDVRPVLTAYPELRAQEVGEIVQYGHWQTSD